MKLLMGHTGHISVLFSVWWQDCVKELVCHCMRGEKERKKWRGRGIVKGKLKFKFILVRNIKVKK